jgi:hypothetical protein
MRRTVLGLAALAALAACSKPATNAANAVSNASAAANTTAASAAPPAAAAAAAVSGTFTANGKPATLTIATAHKGDPFFDKPIIDLVLSAGAQTGSDKPATDAMFGQFGDALVAHIEEDGTVTGVEFHHAGLKNPDGSVSVAGPIKMTDFKSAGGQLSGHLTSEGEIDILGDKVNIDLTFTAKAP